MSDTTSSSFWVNLRGYRPYLHIKEIYITLIGVLWMLLIVYPVYLGIAMADTMNPYANSPPGTRFVIYDPILLNLSTAFKKTRLPRNVSDIMVGICFFLIFLRVFLNGRKTLLLLRRVFYIVGFLYLLRIPFMLTTLMPPPITECVPKDHKSVFFYAKLLMLQKMESCADLMYSGHTIAFTISSLIWIHYPLFKRFSYLINSLLVLNSFLSVIGLIASSYHYTIDVVVSFLLVNFVWHFYHFAVTTNYLVDTWYGKVLLFIDHESYLIKREPEYIALTTVEKIV
ncbi:hypothetical protein K502DRAFT_306009 [Neoconidiobolus thromboides FSU 785]|nr:hypothetical protein K502DRAFT_306009 [Neoconidiobolus thromboides FSU 785]